VEGQPFMNPAEIGNLLQVGVHFLVA